MIEIRQYVDALGRNAFERWFEKLDGGTRARIAISLERAGAGNLSTAKGVGTIFELRLDFGPGYRIYFGKDGDTLVILLAGGTKHRQQNDIEKAQTLWREYRQRKRERYMPLTKSFNTTVKEQLRKSEEFRRALLREAVGCMLTGDLETGKSVLRKYINGTVGFVQLGADLGRSPKVLMRMFGPTGNPQAKNLFEIVAYLQKVEGTVLEVVDRTAA